jgi:hypothetical protein
MKQARAALNRFQVPTFAGMRRWELSRPQENLRAV